MNRTHLAMALFAGLLSVGLVFGYHADADATEASVDETSEARQQTSHEARVCTSAAEPLAKDCTTDSDCPNSDCDDGRCGGCTTDSDCKYGDCDGRCGGCTTDSDCNGWGDCDDGRCGRCTTDSDCGRFGDCDDGRCTRSPY